MRSCDFVTDDLRAFCYSEIRPIGRNIDKEGTMTPNMGNIDRIIRVVVALVVAVLIVTNVLSGVWAWIAGILAVVFLATSAIGFCPLYLPFRIKTR